MMREIETLPGSYGWPIIGTTFWAISDPLGFLKTNILRAARDGFSVFRSRNFGRTTISVTDPKLVKFLLQKENKLLHARWMWHHIPMFGHESIFVVTGERHTLFRRLFDKAFQPGAMDDAFPKAREGVRNHMEKWATHGVTDMLAMTKELTFGIAVKLLLGPGRLKDKKINELRVKYDVFLQGFGSLIPYRIPGTQYYRSMNSRDELVQEFSQVVQQIMDEEEIGVIGDESEFGSIIQILVSGFNYDEGESMNKEQIVDNLLILLFAGGDTSSTVMVLFLIILNSRRDVLDKLRQEQREFIEKTGTEEVTREQIMKEMPYMSAVIQETLKVIPIVKGVQRVAIKDFVLPGTGVMVRKGTGVSLSYIGAHYQHNPATLTANLEWKLHNLFNPDSAVVAMQNGTYDKKKNFGFGGGPRLCLGRPLAEIEMRLFLLELARNYEIELPEDRQYPVLDELIFPSPVDPLPVKLTRMH